MHGRSFAFAAMALLTLSASALADVPRTETHTYVVGGGPVATVCGDITFWTRTTDVGGGCFLLDGTEDRALMVGEDRSSPLVGGTWTVKLSGVIAGGGLWCGTADVDIPTSNGARLFVSVSAIGQGCAAGSGQGPGTVGTVSVTFT